MNKQAIINRYKNKTEPQSILPDGRIVLGEEVDELNRLNYVIKDGNKLSVEYAGNVRQVNSFVKESRFSVIVEMKKKLTI